MKLVLKSRLAMLLLTADTALLRYWFSWASMGYALMVLMDQAYPSNHPLAVALCDAHYQVILFALHAIAMFYGVMTRRYSTTLLFIEGILGVFLWCGIGIAEAIQQGTPGPMLIAGGGISLFLLMRYPTHYEGGDE